MKISKTLLVTRPNYDSTTHYCYHWSHLVIEKAREKSFRTLDLTCEKVTKNNLESYLSKQKPDLLFFNGHGSQTVLAGQNDEPILTEKNFKIIPENSIIYVRSCNVGNILGKKIVSRASAFIGYSKSFGFYRDSKFLRNPTDDSLAGFCFEPSNLVVTTLIKGKTALEANERSKTAMLKNLQYLLSSKALEREKQCAQVLWRNYKYQILIGNSDAHVPI